MTRAGLLICALFLLTGCAVYRPTGAWGYADEDSFLSSCELRTRVAYCACMLGYLEQSVSEQRVVADANVYQSGSVVPTYMQAGAAQCRWAVL